VSANTDMLVESRYRLVCRVVYCANGATEPIGKRCGDRFSIGFLLRESQSNLFTGEYRET
jgi:hypothetical protein